MGTLAEVVLGNARRAPRQPALAQEPAGRVLTYRQLAAAATALAGHLASNGVGAEDRVVLGLPSVLEHLVAYVACSLLEAVTVPLHHDAQPWELQRFFEDCDPSILLASKGFSDRAEEIDHTVAISVLDGGGTFSPVRGRVRSKGRSAADLQGDSDAVLAYTSGTTGQAKAVRVTQDNLAHLFPHQCINHRIPPYGCTTVAMPLSFVAACMDMVQAHLYAGSTVVFHEYFEAELLLRTMDRWHPNFVWMTTPMIDDVASLRKNLPLDLPYLTTFHHGASMLPEVLTRWLFESVGERLMQGYGMTEYSGGIVTATGPRDYRIDEDTLRQRLKTIGRSVIGSDLALVDPSGKELPTEAEVEGEIWLRGPGLSPGYWARDQSVADHDGWFHTGDVARHDADGFIYLRGRIRDTIQSGGATVNASEVESCLRELAGVAVSRLSECQIPLGRIGRGCGRALERFGTEPR